VLPSEIASIASAVSGVTATVSLIYVGIQIRLSMRHTRAVKGGLKGDQSGGVKGSHF